VSELVGAGGGREQVPIAVGEGFEGAGSSMAHVNVVLGDRQGPMGAAFAQALASPVSGHAPFMVVARPGLPVRPSTLFVNKSPIVSEVHASLTWGAAQAGIAAGVVEAVRSGLLTPRVAEAAIAIAAVWVDPEATAAHQDLVYENNYVAVLAALAGAVHDRPTPYEVVSDDGGIWNPFYRP